MAETLVPLRNALAEAYMGDTKVVKDLFSSHETFDQRIVEILTGLGQHVDTPLPSAISGDDLKAVMAALDAQDNSNRVSIINSLKSLVSGSSRSFTYDAGTLNLSNALSNVGKCFLHVKSVNGGLDRFFAPTGLKIRLFAHSPYSATAFFDVYSDNLSQSVAADGIVLSVDFGVLPYSLSNLPPVIRDFIVSGWSHGSSHGSLTPAPISMGVFYCGAKSFDPFLPQSFVRENNSGDLSNPSTYPVFSSRNQFPDTPYSNVDNYPNGFHSGVFYCPNYVSIRADLVSLTPINGWNA